MNGGTIITDPKVLTPGWYALGWERMDGSMQWDQIVEYHGDDYWTDEDGEEKVEAFDPVLQLYVAIDAADAYARQS
jgi:hypothetical protein